MSTATALIVFSHGSLLCGSGNLLQSHVETIRSDSDYTIIEPGYLNYSTPLIEDSVKKISQAEIHSVIIVPYFLVAGKFVREDLPARLKTVKSLYPYMTFTMAKPILDHPRMMTAILALIGTANTPEHWQTSAIQTAHENCELRPDCPLYGTPACKTHSAEDVKSHTGIHHADPITERQSDGDFHDAALMLILHGSPRPQSNTPALDIADQIRTTGRFRHVVVSYLECNEPAIAGAIDQCAAMGINRVVALPYFLHSGRHLVLDIPAELIAARNSHPGMEVFMCDAVGVSPEISKILKDRASEAAV